MLRTLRLAQKAALPIMIAAVLITAQPLSAVYATTETTTTTPSTDTNASASATPSTTSQPATSQPVTQQTAPAEQPSPQLTTQTPATASTPQTGPDKPTGAESSSYVQNKETGNWESDTYIWDPNTGKTTPKNEAKYSYNPATSQWETTEWRYDAPSGKYVPNVVTTSNQAPVDLSPEEKAKALENTASESGAPSSTPAKEANSQSADSNNGAKKNTDNEGFFSGFFNAVISNDIGSSATSGDAAVSGNTQGGSATSGDAAAIANIINMLQSTWGWAGDFTSFMADIYGNVVGDIVLNPEKTGLNPSTPKMDVDINAENNASINNNVNLQAKSGDATVSKNTKAGNATSGDATAVANIINLINSSISAGNSFMGMVNIHGNLDGDILLPPEILKQIKALSLGQTNTNVTAKSATYHTINNNITQNTTSGNAAVDKNTQAGSATTGNTANDLSIINLTGRQVVGDNALLVFVNVFGKWVGMIVDAPAGSTSAALGGGITANKTMSGAPINGNLEINEKNNHTINNNVTVGAESGDATVSENTSAGNATTGDTETAVNIANISNSQLALTKWFGVLFINVFGFWNGSFGVDTSAGEKPAPVVTPSSARTNHKPATGSDHRHMSPALLKLASGNGALLLNNGSVTSAASTVRPESTPVGKSNSEKEKPSAVAMSVSDTASSNAPIAAAPVKDTTTTDTSWVLSAAGLVIGASLLGASRLISIREARKRKLQQHIA